jgi:hypothetical protein
MIVYQLSASGLDGLMGEYRRTIKNSILFTTPEGAEKRSIEFVAACVSNFQLDDTQDIVVDITPIEVID